MYGLRERGRTSSGWLLRSMRLGKFVWPLRLATHFHIYNIFSYLYRMDKFLVKYDFQTLIDQDNLNELTDDNDTLLEGAIDSAVEKVAGYIRHRYDYDKVFRVVKTFTTDTVTGILTGDRIFQSTSELFYVALTDGGTNLATTADFTQVDNRNPLIKEITVDVVLYNIHSKISPENIPDVRRTRYDGFGNLKEGDSAIATLKEIQKGNITLNLPVIEPTVQNTERIAYGSTSNSQYSY